MLGSFILLVAPEWPAFQAERHRLSTLVGLREFDFLTWELNALWQKGQAEAGDGHAYLSAETRRQTVLTYLELVARAGQLEGEISAVFADPGVSDPQATSRALQTELAEVRTTLARLQPLAESIIQEQVGVLLAEEGFALLGEPWPPVQMHMTPLPHVLIVSPRTEIDQRYNVPLVAELTVPEMELLEQGVHDQLDLSALVVPIGGLGFYPSMIVETSSINFLADVVAHEWAHHWLTLQPVGIRYAASPPLRTINETTASIFGEEIGARVVERFYPEYVPPPPPPAPEQEPAAQTEPPGPPPFDFRVEMAQTRMQVDRLLAQGKVEEAEAYMEARRELFVENGYLIRKLNQAYFAFYGAYADTPGATGTDPVGPAVVSLRAQSDSLSTFMEQIAGVTSFEELEALLE